ncbi:MAG: hypothetical protein LUI07_03460 [Lachnospiraceae bacterium]|nr:hypothetical protein [Lachnospiraceae bacterium]
MNIRKNISVIVVASMVLSTSSCARTESNDNVENAIIKKCYETLQETLLDPDSIIVYDCYGHYDQSEDMDYKEWEEELKGTLEEKTYDLYTVYMYIGATNKMGGISGERYVYQFDVYGNYLADCSRKEYEEALDEGLAGDIYQAWAGIDISETLAEIQTLEGNASTAWDDWTEYTDYINSDEFEDLDYEKILNNLPEDYKITEPLTEEED